MLGSGTMGHGVTKGSSVPECVPGLSCVTRVAASMGQGAIGEETRAWKKRSRVLPVLVPYLVPYLPRPSSILKIQVSDQTGFLLQSFDPLIGLRWGPEF